MKSTHISVVASFVIIVSIVSGTFLCEQTSIHASNDSYRAQIDDLTRLLADSRNQTVLLQKEKVMLQNQVNLLETGKLNLENTVAYLQHQVGNLVSQVENLTDDNNALYNLLNEHPPAPYIVTKLGTKDLNSPPADGNYHTPWNTRFFVQGQVFNLGKVRAVNCRLHVVLRQDGKVANDTEIWLGTMNAMDFVYVETNIYYSGAPLTSWDIIPEYD